MKADTKTTLKNAEATFYELVLSGKKKCEILFYYYYFLCVCDSPDSGTQALYKKKTGKYVVTLPKHTPFELKEEFPNELNKRTLFISHDVLIRPFPKNVFLRTGFRVIMTNAHFHNKFRL